MTGNNQSSSTPARSLLKIRKLALMASVVAGLGAAAYGIAPQMTQGNLLVGSAQAQVDQKARQAPAPTGFADVVEHVKPAVISVRVRINNERTAARSNSNDNNNDENANPFPPGSPMERFFRRFGLPEGATPDEPRAPRKSMANGWKQTR